MSYAIPMKPQDILVLLKLLLWKKGRWTIASLADSIGLSASETHAALQRSKKNGLFDPLTEKPIKSALEELLIHGLKYVFPAEIGPRARGIPTAYSAPPLSNRIVSQKEEILVWPSRAGQVLGSRVDPLYPSAPQAVQKDVQLYEMLALIDALRVGRVRERKLAVQELKKRLKLL
jgi:hypothetical protein